MTDAHHPCRCTSPKVQQYLARISGPLLDRIDLHIEVPAVPFQTLTQSQDGEPSAAIKSRIVTARRRQQRRFRTSGLFTNAHMRHRQLKECCPMTEAATDLFKTAMEELQFSARSYDKILKVARTISDLADQDVLQTAHLAEAIQYRSLDRQLWV